MTTSEKVAYLKGLAEGLGIDPATREGKIFSSITDVLQSMAQDVENANGRLGKLEENLDAVTEDLEDLEYVFFRDNDEDWDGDDDEDGGDDAVFYQAQCPSCGEIVTFEEDVLLHGDIQCPICGESLEIDLGEEEKSGGD